MWCVCVWWRGGTCVGVRLEVEDPLLELPDPELGYDGMGNGEAERDRQTERERERQTERKKVKFSELETFFRVINVTRDHI